jgi:competence protein ComEA
MKIKPKYVTVLLFTTILLVVYFTNKEKKEEYKKPELVFQEKVHLVTESIDINTATKRDLVSRGISIKIADKIIEYRNITGCIVEMKELKRIKGIGDKSIEKLNESFFIIGEKFKKNKININYADENLLTLYGFNKKEIKKINDYKKDKKIIFSNIELMDILGENRYREISEYIIYSKK